MTEDGHTLRRFFRFMCEAASAGGGYYATGCRCCFVDDVARKTMLPRCVVQGRGIFILVVRVKGETFILDAAEDVDEEFVDDGAESLKA